MKNKSIIIFDVDNTIVKGNLTLFFLRFLIKEKLSFFISCFSLFLKGAFLILIKLPSMTKKTLENNGNVYLLDQSICDAIKEFYSTLFVTLKKLNLTGNNLAQKARALFDKNFFKKNTYPEAIEKIKHHLKNRENIIVLLSGSPQEILDVFFDHLCKKLDKDKVDCKNRFFAQGTKMGEKKSEVYPCIGSEKNKILKELLKKNGYEKYSTKFIYSDNSFMSDLPLLIESKNGGAVINKKSDLYKFLPKNLIRTLVFLPCWKKST